MFTISMEKLRKQRYYIHHKNKMNSANEKHSQKDKNKVTIRLAKE